MNKIISAFIVLLIHQVSGAQRSIDGLLQAEKNFAAYSVAHDTKEAFLRFADSAGIVFDNGKPVNAIEIWSKREKRPGKLNWWPEYAEVAASGDFGYTSGPWNFTLNDTIRGSGYFISVWHINKQGEWKFLADLGVNRGSITCDFAALQKVVSKVDQQNKGTGESLQQAEENFIDAYRQTGKTVYANFLSSESRLYRNNRCAASAVEQRYRAFDSLPSTIQYTVNGSGIASSGDLGFVYGSTIINGRTDNYQRIWRRERSGWKIALEVLRY